MVKPQTTLVESLDLYHSLDRFDSARQETIRSIVNETFLVNVCYESHKPAYAYNRDQRFRGGQSLIGVISGTAHKVTVQLPSERNDEISACAKDDVVQVVLSPLKWEGVYDRLSCIAVLDVEPVVVAETNDKVDGFEPDDRDHQAADTNTTIVDDIDVEPAVVAETSDKVARIEPDDRVPPNVSNTDKNTVFWICWTMAVILFFMMCVTGGLNDWNYVKWLMPGCVIVVGLWFYLGQRAAKKRTSQFEQVALELGLSFLPQGDESLLDRQGGFHLFLRGRGRKIVNMLHGESDGVELAIFDYRYRTGNGKNSSTIKQSVIYFCSTTLHLPKFAVRQERLFHKIGELFGYPDIDFQSHSRFSKQYLLQGDDEAAVRAVFSDELLTFFENQQKISVEGNGDQMIFYRPGKRIAPDQCKRFMEEGFGVFTRFQGRNVSR